MNNFRNFNENFGKNVACDNYKSKKSKASPSLYVMHFWKNHRENHLDSSPEATIKKVFLEISFYRTPLDDCFYFSSFFNVKSTFITKLLQVNAFVFRPYMKIYWSNKFSFSLSVLRIEFSRNFQCFFQNQLF